MTNSFMVWTMYTERQINAHHLNPFPEDFYESGFGNICMAGNKVKHDICAKFHEGKEELISE